MFFFTEVMNVNILNRYWFKCSMAQRVETGKAHFNYTDNLMSINEARLNRIIPKLVVGINNHF